MFSAFFAVGTRIFPRKKANRKQQKYQKDILRALARKIASQSISSKL
jgi:hypothetical protein